MSKDLELVKSFIQLAKEENVTELKYESNDVKLFVSLGTTTQVVHANPIHSIAQQIASEPAAKANADCYEIKSPFVGTFYLSPAPGKPVYVKVGDRVSKGQTLCILEAMKIMNEIESDVDGELVEISIDNESLVEFGQVLFRVKK
jgi:acetyl-CoA carboxylase biotin carboxyl carrier protein